MATTSRYILQPALVEAMQLKQIVVKASDVDKVFQLGAWAAPDHRCIVPWITPQWVAELRTPLPSNVDRETTLRVGLFWGSLRVVTPHVVPRSPNLGETATRTTSTAHDSRH
jgi:hypothetical protein